MQESKPSSGTNIPPRSERQSSNIHYVIFSDVISFQSYRSWDEVAVGS